MSVESETSAIAETHSRASIELRGVRVHNLKGVDVDLPLNQLTVLTGVSGSGKSSLAFDTLYAEGQRRYIESFSATARRHLDRLEKPDVDRIERIPPAVALRQNVVAGASSARSTIATVTEVDDLLRVLFARFGSIVCPDCDFAVKRDSAADVAFRIAELPEGDRVQIGFRVRQWNGFEDEQTVVNELRESGFSRFVTAERDEVDGGKGAETIAVVDRLVAGKAVEERIVEAVEACFRETAGRCLLLVKSGTKPVDADVSTGAQVLIDRDEWSVREFSSRLECAGCGREFVQPEPSLLSFRSPLGACCECHGRGGEVEPCRACRDCRLNPEALAVRLVATSGGTAGLPSSADKGQYSTAGQASSVTGSVSIADFASWSAEEAGVWLESFAESCSQDDARASEHLLSEISGRLEFLQTAGLGYLSLNRSMASLSRGEAQRVAMTSIAGSRLVNTLFVLDEPSAGLHARDVAGVVEIVQQLRDASNTVVVVEHEPDFLVTADHVLEIGPGAGQDGGRIVFCGTPDSRDVVPCAVEPAVSRRSPSARMQLQQVVCNNVRGVDVEFPLGCLCVVTGVSGAGKSSLVERTLYPALCEGLNQPCELKRHGRWSAVSGFESLSSVQLLDDRPLPATRRSNPATWLKVFDEIRRLFAETEDARNRNLTATHFSFNSSSGGRCTKCDGTGTVEIDMQFLADVSMTCPDCHGTRYESHILDVQWRARTIADVLAMTATEAFSFFRGQPKIQKRLHGVKEVGLDYLTLGQPLSTLSGGESQRLKLAACLASKAKTGSLLILNEPTTGLHPTDVAQLLKCFDGLLSVGHSLIVIEHHLDVIRQADHVVDMGPESGPGGGQIVATGSVADITACKESVTGRFL